MADLIASTRQQIEQRLEELRPLAAEAERLERALEALRGLDSRPAAAAATAAPAPAGRPSKGPRRRGAPRGRREGATRANDFLRIVRASGGASIADAAARMGTSPTYLYRIAATLQGEGLVAKRGRLWVAGATGGGPEPTTAVGAERPAADPLPEEAVPAVEPPAHPATEIDSLPDPAGGPAVPAIEPVPSPPDAGGASGHDPSPTAVPPPGGEEDTPVNDAEDEAAASPAPPPSPFAEGR